MTLPYPLIVTSQSLWITTIEQLPARLQRIESGFRLFHCLLQCCLIDTLLPGLGSGHPQRFTTFGSVAKKCLGETRIAEVTVVLQLLNGRV